MALTMNPAVCGGTGPFFRQSCVFVGGAWLGTVSSVTVLTAVYGVVAEIGGGAWVSRLMVALAVAAVASTDLTSRIRPPTRRAQVPEWMRGVLPPAAVAFSFGFMLGTGVLTYAWFALQLNALLVLPLLPTGTLIAAGAALFATGRALVIVSSIGADSADSAGDCVRWSRPALHTVRLASVVASLALISAVMGSR
jgi:hypothetical protein